MPEVLKSVGSSETALGDYVKIIFLDTVCAKSDRHTLNFGILRDADTGILDSLTPDTFKTLCCLQAALDN